MFELTIVKSLNKAYRQVSIGKLSFGTFKQQLEMLYEQIVTIDTEEKFERNFDGLNCENLIKEVT